MRCPDAVKWLWPGRPTQHRRIERESNLGAQSAQSAFRILPDIEGLDHRSRETLIHFSLLFEPDVGKGRLFPFGLVTGDNARRMADQVNVNAFLGPAHRKPWKHVKTHEFQEKIAGFVHDL